MNSSDLKTIYIYKKPIFRESMLNDMLSEYWFLPPRELSGSIQTPQALYQTYGFKLNESTIHSILYTKSETDIKESDADAILTEFRITPGENKLKQILSSTDKPIIVTLNRGIKRSERIIDEAKKYEQTGASAILTNNLISNSLLYKIKNSTAIPIIAKSDANEENAISKHKAGADIICINGMEISGILIEAVKTTFPLLPVISFAGNSEEIIANSLSSGADAIIYKLWIHVDYFI
jgi:hypothetical protein